MLKMSLRSSTGGSVNQNEQITIEELDRGIDAKFQKYVNTLLSSGLVTKLTDPQGKAFELTEAGARILQV